MRGVYIHIPFCKNICSYCDFCKVYYQDKYIDSYLDSLKNEIISRYNGEMIKTIYIGGGTPSILAIDKLDKLLNIIEIFNLEEDYEYTIECNIEDIDIDKLNIFKSYGINRISIGVQSFDKDNIKILGRNHDEDMVFDKIYLTKKYFNNISIDLIYGIDSDREKVKNDISKFLMLDIPHISCYSLIIEEHTKLYIDNKKYIDDEIELDMFNYINNILSRNGYNHYEISNYAKEGYESIHNKNYWLNGEYYGFGLSAVSYIDNNRINNTKNLNKYMKGNYLEEIIYEDVNIQKENDLILGLRLIEGIRIDIYNNKYKDNLLEREIIRKLVSDGYLLIENNYIKCNYKYIYRLNYILERIMGSDL